MPNRKIALPVDDILPEIIESLHHNPNLVLEAPPGAGKTTRVPAAILDTLNSQVSSASLREPGLPGALRVGNAPTMVHPSAGSGEVIVLEPRRIAARLAARRVAEEMGEAPGETVGYQVRFEEAVGPRTRLRFVTEGILTRRLLADPELKGVAAVVLDEFHERHLDGDLSLALLRRLQRKRPELRIVAMSATLDGVAVAQYLGGCPVLRSEGRRFELAIKHLPYSPEPLEMRVRGAVEMLCGEPAAGGILVFLPGAAEIRRAMRECATIAQRNGLLMLPLHGSLAPKEQDRALAASEERKLILATNVAESSVTVEGVSSVIDSGLARIASYAPWSGLPTLHVGRISQASARQRAGRAGRTGPGRVVRLYSEEDYRRRPEQDRPEILRSDLAQLSLAMRAMNIDLHELEWLDAPPDAAIEHAETLLDRLGATGEMAARMARFPLPPRLSRILVEAMRRGVGEDGCVAAARLASDTQAVKNDLLAAMEMEQDFRLRQQVEQLRRIARPAKQKGHDDDALLIAVLAGFPDRVARRRAGNQVLMSSGASAEIAGESPRYEFMVAVDAEERKDKPLPLIRMTSRGEPEWLVDLFPERVRERASVEWNRTAERVETVSALLYDELVIEESRGAMPDPDAAAEMLTQKALEAGIARFVDVDALSELRARLEFAGFEAPDEAQALRELCMGRRSFAELKDAAAELISGLEQKIGGRRLNEIAPAKIRLRNGRLTKIHYERGKAPWIESRLQDFFGMKETPRVGPGRTPVVVHLLAPNHRAVQTTTDLAGFWERLYPQVRRELMRRYPRHAWPEQP